MDIQASFATQLYNTALKLGGADATPETEAAAKTFGETMAEAAEAMKASLETGETAAMKAVSGQGDVQSVVEALTATELALQTAITVRDKVVEAYQEVLRMPV